MTFLGRDTGVGRVKIFAKFAQFDKNPVAETVLILPDSVATVDDKVIEFFVNHGVSALMIDLRGEWEGAENYTVYPENVAYANTAKCDRAMDYVDTTADKTTWYEWVAAGIFARKFIVERTGSENIAIVGLRDGGEVGWKLAMVKKFSCLVSVCAAGWRAYAGKNKFSSEEVELDEERYRFIGGIDSQAYAPYVQCPVLLLCSSNDDRFDYDRAYDTFSRINPEYAADSVVAYSIQCNACIGLKSIDDMFMYLDKNLKNRQVFIPKPAEITVFADEEQNLVAKASFDLQGIVESCRMYMAEDCLDSSLREWTVCPEKSKTKEDQQFYLNVYEKSSIVFAICYVKYSNGFTVWSKLAVRKISGKFRNMQRKCKVIYTGKDGTDGFSVINHGANAVGGMFINDEVMMPRLVEKSKGVKGLYAAGGLTSYRMNNPRFSPQAGNVLSLDIYTDENVRVIFELTDVATKEKYVCHWDIVGKVWQTLVLEAKFFKNLSRVSLPNFSSSLRFSIHCSEQFAVNNVMWL